MEKMTTTTIGVDISKDGFDVFRFSDRATMRFPNDAKGFTDFIRWLGADCIERIVYEATGAYHRAFERALVKAGMPLAKVNPRQARRFAEAAGRLAKTDRGDAEMLARMGEALNPKLNREPALFLDDLKELLGARNALVKDRTAALNRAQHSHSTLLKKQNAERLQQIKRQLAAIERELHVVVANSAALKARFEILRSIPGIGDIAAFSLLIEMPELGSLEAKQAAALAGLAPMTRQSGKWSGRASIRGGRFRLRQAMYMPALVAIRFNADMRATYRRLIDAGKPAKLGLTAVMRKLIVLANTLLRAGRPWIPIHPSSAQRALAR